MKHEQNNKPRLLALELTRRCRFNCRHCRADAGAADRAEELSTGQWTRILDAIAAYEKCVIILTGGEPMEREDIHDLIRHGKGLGLRMVMATCGYAIDDKSVAALQQAGVMALSFSLDGAQARTHDTFRRTPGAFDTVVRAAETARRAGMRFQINTTITRSNLAEAPAIAELARRLGAYCWNPFVLVPTGRGEEMVDELLEPRQYAELLADLLTLKTQSPIELRVTCGPQYARLYRETAGAPPASSLQPSASMAPNGCMGGRGFGFISYRGDVQTCGFLDLSAGNLVESGYDFAKVWDGSKLLNEIRDLPSYKGRCGRCAFVKVCGGCRARAYAMTGDYLAEDPICWYPRATHASPLLTDLQKRLVSRLQDGLPFCSQPFAEIARLLGGTETQVLEQTRTLKESGVIRRLSAVINPRALGMASTLVTAHVPTDRIDAVAVAVNALTGVSHNYLREHHYNLWFTLQEPSADRIAKTLLGLHRQFGIEFHSLLVTQVFKLDVRFDPGDDDAITQDVVDVPVAEPASLRPEHKRLLESLQQGIEVTSRPFDALLLDGQATEDVLRLLVELNALGVLRRVAAVMDHRRLGYAINILFAAEVPAGSIVEAGRSLARFRAVSHCYARETFEGWPYNLFAMLHARSETAVTRTIHEFTTAASVHSYRLLPTVAELKKQPVRHTFL
jgi:AdoMet-dependent heme synthase